LFDIVKNGKSSNKNREKAEAVAFVNYPPEARILPPKPILLDLVFLDLNKMNSVVL
jgi:hypothetical protein